MKITRFLSVQNPAQVLDAYTKMMSIRFDAGYNLYQLISDVILMSNNPNVKLNLTDEDKNIIITTEENYNTYNLRTLDDILNLYSIKIAEGYDLTLDYISNETYLTMNSDRVPPDASNTIEVNENTGLINIPTLQSSGDYPTVRFKMMFDSRIKPFMYVKIRNADIQLVAVEDVTDVDNFNTGIYLDYGDNGYGYYLVLKITYSLDSRGGNFTQDIEASPYNLYNKIAQDNIDQTNTEQEVE